MAFEIIGKDVDVDALFCTGSFTKLLTTFVSLNWLAQDYNLQQVIDDENFLSELGKDIEAKQFLRLFQQQIGSNFSIRDLCSFYTGLPYTFNLSTEELQAVEDGLPFKHHSILTEEDFINHCQQLITPVFAPRCKFHYSEIAILLLGYYIEKCSGITIEELYQTFVMTPFELSDSVFSRVRPLVALTKDLSPEYDYPSIAVLDHGYFCYSNGFYTTLREMKKILQQLVTHPVFAVMTDSKKARAASHRLLNGLTVEIRLFEDDIIYGYEGLSFSGCNIWNYSTKHDRGLLAFTDNEELAYQLIYDDFGYGDFKSVTPSSEILYKNFLQQFNFDEIEHRSVPKKFQGKYRRVNINNTTLILDFEIGSDYLIIRNPDFIRYEIIYFQCQYRIKGKDGVPSTIIALYQTKRNYYFLFDGTLYRKLL